MFFFGYLITLTIITLILKFIARQSKVTSVESKTNDKIKISNIQDRNIVILLASLVILLAASYFNLMSYGRKMYEQKVFPHEVNFATTEPEPTKNSNSNFLDNISRTIKRKFQSDNFIDFQAPNSVSEEDYLKETISSGRYTEAQYNDLFNYLYFLFHNTDNTPIHNCIDSKATSECTFDYAVINGDESACKSLPYLRVVASPGKYGTSYFNTYYQLSCVLNTRMLKKYNAQDDKVQSCMSISNIYFKRQCMMYTCESYYWDKEKPSQCTDQAYNDLILLDF